MKRGVLVVCLFLISATTAQAATCTTCTWSGGGGSASWSTGSNWVGGNPPASPVTSLTFPSTATSFTSNNDIGTIATGSLSIDNGSAYTISGNGIVVGAGGLQASPTSGTGGLPTISAPVTLNATPETWSVDGGTAMTPGGLLLTQDIADASPEALNIDLMHQGLLGLEGGADVGAITVSGSGTVGLGSGVSLNGASGSAVSFGAGTSLIVTGGTSPVGPLTLTSASLQVGVGSTPAILSALSGGANSFDSGSTVNLLVTQAGNLAGTDYSQFRSGGSINLGGATLHLSAPSPCPALNVGDVLSLVATTGSLSGTFSNAPTSGSTLQLTCSGGSPATLQINYTASAATATVISSTFTTLTPSTTTPVTNQPVKLTAKVSATYGSAAPQGTVEFDNNGTALPGCTTVPVDSTGTATCQPTFAATASPESLTASFTPTSGSGFGASATSSATPITVAKAPTSLALSISNATPSVGDEVTYTAVVTPAYAGAALESGDVTFSDDGTPIPACTNETQSIDSTGMTATCTVTFTATGSHSISASYPGDGNFTGSSAAAQTVNVQQSGSGNGNGSGNGTGNGKGRLVVNISTLKVTHGKVSITLQCSSQKACAGGFVITGKHLRKHRSKKVVCGAGSYQIAAGKSETVSVKLRAVCLSGLRHARGHHIQVRLSSKPRSGQAGTSKVVVLKL